MLAETAVQRGFMAECSDWPRTFGIAGGFVMNARFCVAGLILFLMPVTADAGGISRLHSSADIGSRHYSFQPGFSDSRYLNSAARDGLAAWYARTAVSQSRAAHRYRCAGSHPRWSASYREHYRWAVRQKSGKLYREVERRERVLNRCLIR